MQDRAAAARWRRRTCRPRPPRGQWSSLVGPDDRCQLILDASDLADDAPPIPKALQMRNDVDRTSDMPGDGGGCQLARARKQELEPAQRVTRRAGVYGGQRACVAGAQRLEQSGGVARRSDLSDDDPIGPHPKRIYDKVRHSDATVP